MSEELETTPGAVEVPLMGDDAVMEGSGSRRSSIGRSVSPKGGHSSPEWQQSIPAISTAMPLSSSSSSSITLVEDMARISKPAAASGSSRASPSASSLASKTTMNSKPKPKPKGKAANAKTAAKGRGKAPASTSTPGSAADAPTAASASTIPASKKKKTASGGSKVTATAAGSAASSASTGAEATLLAKKELEKERKRIRMREVRAAAAAAAAAQLVEEVNALGEEEEPAAAAADDEDEDTKLYCICQTLYDQERMMIQCDRCDEWYHTSCMKMDDDQAELVDMFICPICEPSTQQRTTWKQRCARPTCTHAALLPLSRYCSQRCGVLQAAARIAKTKQGRAGQPDRLLGRRIKAAQLTEGIVVWAGTEGADSQQDAHHDSTSPSPLPPALITEWFERVGDLWGPKGTWEPTDASLMRLVQPRKAVAKVNGHLDGAYDEDLSGSVHLSPRSSKEDEEILILRSRLSALLARRADVNAHLDILSSRLKLLHLADDRAAGLPLVRLADESAASAAAAAKKKSSAKKGAGAGGGERTGPRCGYDERLHWDDEGFEAWAAKPAARDMLDDRADLDGWLSDAPQGYAQPVQDAKAPVVCGTAKRKCKRHLDWSVVRGADFEVERDVQTNILSALAAEEQAVRLRIDTLQRAVADRRAAEAEKDAALAAALAKSGDRRAARGLL